MKKHLWELTIRELDQEIILTKAILESGGYDKKIADHLAALEEHRTEREVEGNYA